MTKNISQVTEELSHCDHCYLKKNGVVLPEYTEHSKYIILMEQPLRGDREHVDKFWELARKVGVSRNEFLELNTVQCYTDKSKRKGRYNKPSVAHREECRYWFNRYADIIEPEKILVMGNVAMETITGEFDGIVEKNGTVVRVNVAGLRTDCVLSVGTSYLQEFGPGYDMIKKSLGVFMNL